MTRTYTKHGRSYERLYAIWGGMKRRCHHVNAKNYPQYGGRRIFVCDEWRADYETFRKWSMENGYADNLTIDRIDNDKGYEPENCRWVTARVNQRNRRNNKHYEIWGETKSLAEWSSDPRCKVEYSVLWERIHDGWTPEEAMIKVNADKTRTRTAVSAFGETKNITDWAADPRCTVNFKALYRRLSLGWEPERAISQSPRLRALA